MYWEASTIDATDASACVVDDNIGGASSSSSCSGANSDWRKDFHVGAESLSSVSSEFGAVELRISIDSVSTNASSLEVSVVLANLDSANLLVLCAGRSHINSSSSDSSVGSSLSSLGQSLDSLAISSISSATSVWISTYNH